VTEFSWAKFWGSVFEVFGGDPEYWMIDFPLSDLIVMMWRRNARDRDEEIGKKVKNVAHHSDLLAFEQAINPKF
jgi:hypothetical protein